MRGKVDRAEYGPDETPDKGVPPLGCVVIDRQDRCTHCPSDGTPAAVATNSRYHPGGASVGSVGICSSTASVAVTCSGRSTSRCSLSDECVVAPGRMRHAVLTRAASGTSAVSTSRVVDLRVRAG